ncbi:hypothetical protein N7497_000955 [Penicillium chrysogenum]|nr:hypothetical protein N7497_000955 [Penicillium chrysogenum]
MLPRYKPLSSAHVLILPRLPRSSFYCLRRWSLCLAQFSEDALEVGSSDNGKALVVPLKQLLWNSPKLWENPVRGVVVKCNDDISSWEIGITPNTRAWNSLLSGRPIYLLRDPTA